MAADWNAKTSDPEMRGLMKGFPPESGLIVRLDEVGLSGNSFPNTRWSFSHQREMKATANIRRGAGPAYVFPKQLRDDIDAITFTTQEGQKLSWAQSLDEMFTDGIVVLHRGAIVYETFRGALKPHLPHIAFSVTKSFVGLIAAMLAHEGALDPDALVTRYVPDLAGTAYGDATVHNVMDMTIGVQYSENYTDPNAEVRTYGIAAGYSPQPPGYTGPDTIFSFLRTLKKHGEHGQAFAYKTCNTEVLSWIIPPRHRQAFLLTALEGFTIDEAAQILDESGENVRQLIARAQRDIEGELATEVLIIEDEPVIAADIEALVLDLGHRVSTVATTRTEAVAAVKQRRPGLVLADIQLADGSSGIDAVNDILKGHDVPVIFITAFPERLLTGEKPEPAFLITKPFQPETVKAAIGQALFFHVERPVAA